MTSAIPKTERSIAAKDPLCPNPGLPGGVYLCQVNKRISCAACCGLYNVSDPSPAGLDRMLTRRTEMFEKTPRNPQAILGFRDSLAAEENQTRPIEEFHHCPFIGLAGPDRFRVGCLLHPLADGNRGVDFRGLSHYGSLACHLYFCPTYSILPGTHKEIVRLCAGNWHLYGLVITEKNLLQSFFGEVERQLGRPLKTDDILNSPAAEKAVRRFLRLKLSWPYPNLAYPSPVHYFFKDPICPKPLIDYHAIGSQPSRHHTLFKELASAFRTPTELLEAEALVDDLVDGLVHAVTRSCPD